MEYIRSKKENLNELVEFINRVFTEHNGTPYDVLRGYNRVLIENDETLSWHIAAVDNGKICGTAGSYPMEYKVEEFELKIGAIEAVSVDSSYRGHGIMQSMLGKIFEDEKDKYDMYHLLGDRWRYRNFGFERCSSIYCFDFTRSMLGKEPPKKFFEFADVAENDSYDKEIFELYKSQKDYLEIDFNDLTGAVKSKTRKPVVVLDSEKNVAGYFMLDLAGTSFIDFVLKDIDDMRDVLKCYFDKSRQYKLYISLPIYSELFDFAFNNAERYKIMQPGSFKIVNFKKVVETFMTVKSRMEFMPDGKITIDSEIFGKWSISKNAENIDVSPFEGVADYSLPGFSVYHFLFGTLPPKAVGAEDALIKQWFPLPLHSPSFR